LFTIIVGILLGTHDALIKFANNAFSALNSSLAVLGIFIDFSKAFDTIDHHILTKKLCSVNFSNESVKLIQHYLSDLPKQCYLSSTKDQLWGTARFDFRSYIIPTIYKWLN